MSGTISALAAFIALAPLPAESSLQNPVASAFPSMVYEREFDTALGLAGLTLKTARFDDSILSIFRQGDGATPLYTILTDQPWKTPQLGEIIRGELMQSTDRPSESLMVAGRYGGFAVRRTLIGNPVQPSIEFAKQRNPLAKVLDEYQKDGILAGALPSLGSMPESVNSAAALVLHALKPSFEFRKAGLGALGDLGPHYQTVAARPNEDEPMAFEAMNRRLKATNLSALVAGGHDVSAAAQEALGLLANVPANLKYDLRIETTWGAVVLTGGSNSRHESGALLVIDTGGDDTYVNVPATSSATNWASIVIDLAGNDKYLGDAALANSKLEAWPGRRAPSNRPGPGGALFGYAVLIDRAGDDLYRSHRSGLGSARFGTATLLDLEGNDTYDAYQDGQGFAYCGVGVLEDSSGDDRYAGFTQIQGVGLHKGVGLLIDRRGKDEYIANDSVIDFPSPQTPQRNVSMGQGAGNGRRADYLDGRSLAGGIGILFDQAGDDTYSCGVFGQGVGYWMGCGFLWDQEGNDTYKSVWYGQGASAHFAIGVLEDLSGRDEYVASMNMAQGAGHDFGYGYLGDYDGNDVYQAPNLSLGAGNANGIGIFLDRNGDDRYESSGVTLGRAAEAQKNSLRARALCLGVFLDLGGQDTYPAQATWAKNSNRAANWTDRLPIATESQLGIFMDR